MTISRDTMEKRSGLKLMLGTITADEIGEYARLTGRTVDEVLKVAPRKRDAVPTVGSMVIITNRLCSACVPSVNWHSAVLESHHVGYGLLVILREVAEDFVEHMREKGYLVEVWRPESTQWTPHAPRS